MLLTRFKTNAVFFENLNKNIEGFVVNKEHRIIVARAFKVTLDSGLDCSDGKPLRKDCQTNTKLTS